MHPAAIIWIAVVCCAFGIKLAGARELSAVIGFVIAAAGEAALLFWGGFFS